jgi:hypothetical protein
MRTFFILFYMILFTSIALTQDIYGCTDPDACNYNPEATIDDGTCLYWDCEWTCGGLAIIDECGICCGGFTGEECSWWVDENNYGGMYDCLGICWGWTHVDDCGICDDNSDNDDQCYSCEDPSAENFGDYSFFECECIYNPPGDLNGDGEYNIADIVAIVDEIITMSSYSHSADLNFDDVVDILDIITLLIHILNNNNDQITFFNQYGTEYPEFCYGVTSTPDNGYLMVGYRYDMEITEPDILLIKTDQLGNQEWELVIGDNGHYEVAKGIIRTNDNKYMIVGDTIDLETGQRDILVIKLNQEFDIEWERTYQNGVFARGIDIKQTPDEGFVILGRYHDTPPSDIWLIKIDTDGDIEWSQTYGGTDNELASDIVLTDDGGYVFYGNTESYSQNPGTSDLWLVKLDEFGGIEWDQTFGGNGNDQATSLSKSFDGGYLLTGWLLGRGNYDQVVIKTDPYGESIWTSVQCGIESDSGHGVMELDNGSILVFGRTSSYNDATRDVMVTKYGLDGENHWYKMFIADFDSSHEYVKDSHKTSDGGHIVAGYTFAGNRDFFLLKLNANVDLTE